MRPAREHADAGDRLDEAGDDDLRAEAAEAEGEQQADEHVEHEDAELAERKADGVCEKGDAHREDEAEIRDAAAKGGLARRRGRRCG